MSFWRSQKRRRASQQPVIPGLFATPSPVVRRIASSGEKALELAKARLLVSSLLFCICFLVVGGRLVELTAFSDTPDLVSGIITTADQTVTTRADITDRNGVVLATSLPTISVCANTRKMIDISESIDKIAAVLPDLDKKKLQKDLSVTKSCIMIQRHLTPKQTYALNKLGIAGLEFLPDERRIYPSGNLTSHVVGFTDIDNVGLAGIEKGLNGRLQQEPTSVALSLDIRLQTLLHRQMSEGVKEFKAEAGAGLIMDVTNGEILAMVSLPDFDPQRPSEGSDEARFNRNTLGVYEMGSTFKIFNTALALQSGVIKLSDVFETTTPIEVGRRFIRDYHPEKEPLNVAEIFMHSSNVGSALMAQRMGSIRQRAFLANLGLMNKVALEIPEVGAPIVPSAANWGDATTMTVSFGHGIAVNEVQTASAISSLVNGGFKVSPTLLKNNPKSHKALERVISTQTSEQLRALMRLVITDGTAKKAEVEGYLVGGKTGTANKQEGKHYSENARRASFVGVFPINDPRYLVLVLLDDPKGSTKTYGYATAGWTAAPMTAQIITQAGPLLGVQPIETEIAKISEQQMLRVLGSKVLTRLQVNEEEDYASTETSGDR